MIVFTVLLLMVRIYILTTGTMFVNTQKELLQQTINNYDGKYVDIGGLGMKCIGVLIFGIVMALINLMYLIFAFPIDTLKYPTLAMVVISFGSVLIKAIKDKLCKSPDKTDEQARAEAVIALQNVSKRSITNTLINLISIGYLFYILYLLMGGNV